MRVLERNPASDASPPRAKRASAQTIRALDQDRLNDLLRALKGSDLFVLAALAAGTGARRGELLALRWSDVDTDALTLRIERSVEQSKKYGVRIVDELKNASSRRMISIDQGLAAFLRGEWRRKAELQLKLGCGRSPLALILQPDPTQPDKPWSPDWISRKFGRRATACGFATLRLHDLRHTHATLLLLDGVPVHAVAQRLGHSSPIVTMTTYAHVLKRAEDRAAESAGRMLKSVLESE